MNVKEARKISNEYKPIAEKKAKEEKLLWEQKEIERMQKEEKLFFQSLDYCYACIQGAAKKGQTEVRIDFNSTKFLRGIVARLQLEGYEAIISSDTVFVGVDDWEENYFLVVSW